jgi:hypothetical protein
VSNIDRTWTSAQTRKRSIGSIPLTLFIVILRMDREHLIIGNI